MGREPRGRRGGYPGTGSTRLGPFARAELLRCLLLPDYDRAGTIGEYHQDPRTRTFAELLIDAEEDRTLRAVLVGMPRERNR